MGGCKAARRREVGGLLARVLVVWWVQCVVSGAVEEAEEEKWRSLVGVGVGNLRGDAIEGVIQRAVGEHGVRLIDTAAASRNEETVRRAARQSARPAVDDSRKKTRVVTKVWYTYLGYERTRLSVESSVRALGEDVDVVVLLHWPRCREDIEWMRCAEEEAELPVAVKALGPAPHLDRWAWKASWRALEDAFTRGEVAGIGVSNFDLDETRELFEWARIQPSVSQLNVWHVFFDPDLCALLESHNVLMMVFNVMNGILSSRQRRRAPRAYADLETLGPPATVVCAWLVKRGVAVVPRASTDAHLLENSPARVADLAARLDATALRRVERAARALFVGRDVSDVVDVAFVNHTPKPVHLYWIDAHQQLVPVAQPLLPGQRTTLNTFHGHRFHAAARDTVSPDDPTLAARVFLVDALPGDSQTFHISFDQPDADHLETHEL